MLPTLGPAFPDLGWVPAPRYLLRRERIRRLSARLPPGKLLEVGPGSGALLLEFASDGHTCTALEASAAARALITQVVRSTDVAITIVEQPRSSWNGHFDALFAFEVLEHIADDIAALSDWKHWLRPGGVLLLSVPAHAHSWSAGDVWAGHYRRYERTDLLAQLAQAGFVVEHLECYGFPIANVLERLASRGYARRIRHDAMAAEDRAANNDRSGIDRRRHLRAHRWLASLLGRVALGIAFAAQALFLNTDLGSGYLIIARKP